MILKPLQIILGGAIVAVIAVIGTVEVTKERHFVSPTPTPLTPTTSASIPKPTLQPTQLQTLTPKVEGTSIKKVSNDPVIACKFEHSGTIYVSQSKCNLMTDCEIDKGEWQAVFKTDCDALHAKQGSATQAVTPTKAVTVSKEYVPTYVDGKTLQCEKDAVSAIKDAEQGVKEAYADNSKCRDKMSNELQPCIDRCSKAQSEGYKLCNTINDWECSGQVTKDAYACSHSCRDTYDVAKCSDNTFADYHYKKLDELTNQYCK